MIRHERLRPPSRDYPADEWSVVEKAFHPEFLAQLETMLAVGNGYLGMRGGPEEGGPNAENGTFINGFHETWPIVYGEDAFGFARTGQTICNVTDCKIIKLFVDDEPFCLPGCGCQGSFRKPVPTFWDHALARFHKTPNVGRTGQIRPSSETSPCLQASWCRAPVGAEIDRS